MIVSAQFPAGVWNGLTPNPHRKSRAQNSEPYYQDWDQMAAEIIALETAAIANGQTNIAVQATTATTGYTYLPTVAGTPTGVPTARTGYAAAVYDTTAHKLWIYDGGWKYAAMT